MSEHLTGVSFEQWVSSPFWDFSTPGEHFQTPSIVAPEALTEILAEFSPVDPAAIVDVGAGGGELLLCLARRFPAARLIAVDRRAVPGPFESCVDRWDERHHRWSGPVPRLVNQLRLTNRPVLVVAVEWLDDLACRVLPDDRSSCSAAEAGWLQRWWPRGVRREVGLGRDLAWEWLARSLPPDSVLATIDYGHTRSERPAAGGLAAHAHGRQVTPVADGSVNLTASVAVDSLADRLERLGCRRLRLDRLSEVSAGAYQPGGVGGLALRSQRAVLRDPARFGRFWLVAHRIPAGLTPPGDLWENAACE